MEQPQWRDVAPGVSVKPARRRTAAPTPCANDDDVLLAVRGHVQAGAWVVPHDEEWKLGEMPHTRTVLPLSRRRDRLADAWRDVLALCPANVPVRVRVAQHRAKHLLNSFVHAIDVEATDLVPADASAHALAAWDPPAFGPGAPTQLPAAAAHLCPTSDVVVEIRVLAWRSVHRLPLPNGNAAFVRGVGESNGQSAAIFARHGDHVTAVLETPDEGCRRIEFHVGDGVEAWLATAIQHTALGTTACVHVGETAARVHVAAVRRARVLGAAAGWSCVAWHVVEGNDSVVTAEAGGATSLRVHDGTCEHDVSVDSPFWLARAALGVCIGGRVRVEVQAPPGTPREAQPPKAIEEALTWPPGNPRRLGAGAAVELTLRGWTTTQTLNARVVKEVDTVAASAIHASSASEPSPSCDSMLTLDVSLPDARPSCVECRIGDASLTPSLEALMLECQVGDRFRIRAAGGEDRAYVAPLVRLACGSDAPPPAECVEVYVRAIRVSDVLAMHADSNAALDAVERLLQRGEASVVAAKRDPCAEQRSGDAKTNWHAQKALEKFLLAIRALREVPAPEHENVSAEERALGILGDGLCDGQRSSRFHASVQRANKLRIEAHVKAADAAIELERWAIARAACVFVLSREPHHVRALLLLAEAYAATCRGEEAQSVLGVLGDNPAADAATRASARRACRRLQARAARASRRESAGFFRLFERIARGEGGGKAGLYDDDGRDCAAPATGAPLAEVATAAAAHPADAVALGPVEFELPRRTGGAPLHHRTLDGSRAACDSDEPTRVLAVTRTALTNMSDEARAAYMDMARSAGERLIDCADTLPKADSTALRSALSALTDADYDALLHGGGVVSSRGQMELAEAVARLTPAGCESLAAALRPSRADATVSLVANGMRVKGPAYLLVRRRRAGFTNADDARAVERAFAALDDDDLRHLILHNGRGASVDAMRKFSGGLIVGLSAEGHHTLFGAYPPANSLSARSASMLAPHRTQLAEALAELDAVDRARLGVPAQMSASGRRVLVDALCKLPPRERHLVCGSRLENLKSGISIPAVFGTVRDVVASLDASDRACMEHALEGLSDRDRAVCAGKEQCLSRAGWRALVSACSTLSVTGKDVVWLALMGDGGIGGSEDAIIGRRRGCHGGGSDGDARAPKCKEKKVTASSLRRGFLVDPVSDGGVAVKPERSWWHAWLACLYSIFRWMFKAV